MSLRSRQLERMQALGMSPKRSLGQNFLVAEHVVEAILDSLARLKPEKIVEVGPGLGALTEGIRERFPKTPITVIELDRAAAAFWREILPEGSVFEADALTLDWSTLKLPPGTVCVGNLPYQISSSLVIERTLLPAGLEAMIFMFQKEVAQRIAAPLGDSEYGVLSVASQMRWKIRKVVDANPACFHPRPRVASRVLEFRLNARELDAASARQTLAVVKRAFAHRRKKLVGNFGAQGATVAEYLERWGLPESARPQNLSVEQYMELAAGLLPPAGRV